MEIFPKSYRGRPSVREALFLLALISSGFVGNYLNTELFGVLSSGLLWALTLIFFRGTFLDSHAKTFALMSMSELNQNNRVLLDNVVNSSGENIISGLLNTETISSDGTALLSDPKQRSVIFKRANQISILTHQLHHISSIYGYVDAEGIHFTMIMPITGEHPLAATFNPKVFADRLTEIAHHGQYIGLRDGLCTIIARIDKRDLYGFFQGIDLSHLPPPIERLGSLPGPLEKGLLGRYGYIYE